jgi:hypothetical protein
MTTLDPDIAKVLDLARIDRDQRTNQTIALADRMLLLHTGTNGVINHAAAASSLMRRLER